MSNDPGLYARSFADVYDAWYGDLDDPDALVAAFHDRCEPGAVLLEMGSGTGRLATPLHQAGFCVVALDASHEMLTDAPAGPLPLAADMAQLPLADDSADAALVAYNTFFNLSSRSHQQSCFDELARVLRPGAVMAIEAFITPAAFPNSAAEFGMSWRPHPVSAGERVAILSGPDPHDPHVIVGSHIEVGARTVCRPWRLVYQSPTELDRGAERAGLVLRERFASWDGAPFDPDGERHVSWYTQV